MAKPISNGKGETSSSYVDKTWKYEFGEGGWGTPPIKSGTNFDKSNDFVYLTEAAGSNIDYSAAGPTINGGKGADQLILTEDATVLDTFFTNLSSFEVLKLHNGTGSEVELNTEALEAGFKEVSGGSGNDTISFGTAYDGDTVLATNVKVDGGAGDDTITTAGGDDIIIGGEGADTFVLGSATDAGVDVIRDLSVADNDLIKTSAEANTAALALTDVGTLLVGTDPGQYADLAGLLATFAAAGTNETDEYEAYTFTFDSKSYLLVDNGTAGYDAGTDSLVEITVTGTLTADKIYNSVTTPVIG